MFSLIITVISIALVALLAFASIYYGGGAFERSKVEAEAAQYINESSQIAGAVRLYQADNAGNLPTDPSVLVPRYLTSIPQTGTVNEEGELVLETKHTWSDGRQTIVADMTSASVCESINVKAGLSDPAVASCDNPKFDEAVFFCCSPDADPAE